MAGERSIGQWATRTEAAKLFLRGHSARVAGPVALVVGTILSLANQGSIVVSGNANAWTVARIVINFLTPFVVASVGFFAGCRERAVVPWNENDPQL